MPSVNIPKKISIEKILTEGDYSKALTIKNHDDLHVILDTSAITKIPMARCLKTSCMETLFTNQRKDGGEYKIILTNRLIKEMHKFPDLIPWEKVNHIYKMTEKVIDYRITPQDFNFIREIDQKAVEKNNVESKNPIGITDAQMMMYSLDRAIEQKPTLILTNDSHILRTMGYLRNTYDLGRYLKKYMVAFKFQNVIDSQNKTAA